MASTWQYWRLNFNGPTNGGGSNVVSINEWRFYDGSNNEISRSGGTATALQTLGGFPASQAFDNNAGTVWASTAQPSSGSPIWLQYQFTGTVTVSFISVQITSDNSAWLTQAPTAFQIQGSNDGSTWTTITSYTGITWIYGPNQVKNFDASTTVGNARTSQVVLEAVTQGPKATVSQIAVETLGGSNPHAIASQIMQEIMGGSSPNSRIAQIVIEVMYPYTPPAVVQPVVFVLP